VALLAGVLLVALLFARSCGSAGNEISSERAVELARQEASFTPDREQVRLVQRGIPPRSYWGVSLYDVDANGRPTRVEVFLVDRKTGDVTKR
jgi:hypothetical protein